MPPAAAASGVAERRNERETGKEPFALFAAPLIHALAQGPQLLRYSIGEVTQSTCTVYSDVTKLLLRPIYEGKWRNATPHFCKCKIIKLQFKPRSVLKD